MNLTHGLIVDYNCLCSSNRRTQFENSSCPNFCYGRLCEVDIKLSPGAVSQAIAAIVVLSILFFVAFVVLIKKRGMPLIQARGLFLVCVAIALRILYVIIVSPLEPHCRWTSPIWTLYWVLLMTAASWIIAHFYYLILGVPVRSFVKIREVLVSNVVFTVVSMSTAIAYSLSPNQDPALSYVSMGSILLYACILSFFCLRMLSRLIQLRNLSAAIDKKSSAAIAFNRVRRLLFIICAVISGAPVLYGSLLIPYYVLKGHNDPLMYPLYSGLFEAISLASCAGYIFVQVAAHSQAARRNTTEGTSLKEMHLSPRRATDGPQA
jgi:hypothetical protein